MSQINLLSNDSVKQGLPWQRIQSFLSIFLTILVLVLFLGYVYLFVATRLLAKDIFETQNKIISQSKETVDDPQRKQVVARQGQLDVYNAALANQAKWSSFLAGYLAPTTLKNARYVLLSAQNDGNLRLSVSVPTYADLDKFLRVFDDPKLNKVFYDIKVGSLSKSQVGDKLDIRFEVSMKYKKTAIKDLEK